MKTNIFSSILVFLLLSSFDCSQLKKSIIFELSQNYPQELQQLHQNLLTHILGDPADAGEVGNLLASLTAEGSWTVIDYTSKERGAWEPRQHLTNILQIAKAYQSSETKFYQKAEVSTKIHLALNYWLDNDFMCPNWWYPVIGVPMMLNPIMILMEAELSEDQLKKALVILNRCEIGRTGQNKVWQSGNVMLSSLLIRDIATVKKAAISIQEELVVSLGEGVQPDWSYHQHGPQLQFGNYGLSYVGDMIKWITILRETPFAFDETKVSILRNYLIKGQQWVTWKNQMDISACGRQLFVDSPEGKAGSLARSIDKMKTLDLAFEAEYEKANDYETLSGNKHFWRSDIQIQRSSDYYFSVKMCSERVIGAESCNSENIQGYYMGDGATFLYQTGEEYRNIFPFLDWKKIPGTTTQQDDDPLPVLTASGYRIESDFVGGVSDGENGVAVLDYNRNGLKARKSWFMMDGKIVCLGTGISSSKGLEVTTSVNQSFLKGSVLIKSNGTEIEAKEIEEIKDPSWILHDGLGYFFPAGGKLKLDAKSAEGSWNWVASRYPDERINGDIFKLWFDHGTNPAASSYAYVLIPNADKIILNKQQSQPSFLMINETDRQEIVSSDGSSAGIVFYSDGKSDIFGGIKVDQPCVLLLKKNTGGLVISVADPTQQLSAVQITIDGAFEYGGATVQKGNTTLSIQLPTGGEAGKSSTVRLRKI